MVFDGKEEDIMEEKEDKQEAIIAPEQTLALPALRPKLQKNDG